MLVFMFLYSGNSMVDLEEKKVEDIKLIYIIFVCLIHRNTTSVKHNCVFRMYLLYTAANGNFRCFIRYY